MPRNLHIKHPFRPSRIPAILRPEVRKPGETIVPYTPRLWNAKRRIKTSQGLSRGKYFEYRRDPRSTDWRSHVSPDVAAFIDRNPNLLPEEKGDLLRGPSKYFSRPHHVPLDQRKQIYLPRFSIMLIRTPRLGPHYAHFQVPLWFNKLDMKSYLKNVYDVDIVHVRSSVTWGKKDHRQPYRPGGVGDAFRHRSKKRMTVQLAEPFEWPEEVKDFVDWEKEEFHRSMMAQVDVQRRESRQYTRLNPNTEHRYKIARQAQDLLKGKASWKPTWTQIPRERRVMGGIVGQVPENKEGLQLPPPSEGDMAGSSPMIPPR